MAVDGVGVGAEVKVKVKVKDEVGARSRARVRVRARAGVVKRIKQLRCLWMNLMMTWITTMLELSTLESFLAEELFCGIKYINSSQF